MQISNKYVEEFEIKNLLPFAQNIFMYVYISYKLTHFTRLQLN